MYMYGWGPCCPAETVTKLLIDYTSIESKKLKKNKSALQKKKKEKKRKTKSKFFFFKGKTNPNEGLWYAD